MSMTVQPFQAIFHSSFRHGRALARPSTDPADARREAGHDNV